MSNERDDTKKKEAEFSSSGRVRFDDRGNAVWQTWRGRRLEHPALKLVDDGSGPSGSFENRKGKVIGYDPYQSGMLRKEKKQRTDLRALSKWIELTRRLEAKRDD